MKIIMNVNSLTNKALNKSMSKTQPLSQESSLILRNTGSPDKDSFVSFRSNLNCIKNP